MGVMNGTLNGKPMRGIVLDEYLRRNLIHASAVGAQSAIIMSLCHLRTMKRVPRWLLDSLEGAEKRLAAIPHELAEWRNSIRKY